MNKSQKFKIQAIQKEQLQLVKIEKTLETLLGDIKESINTMKVEELQLKSSLVEHFTNSCNQEEQPTTSAQAAAADTSSSTLLWLNTEQVPVEQATAAGGFIDESINRQLLDLETLLVPMKKREISDDEDEEEDEEDEDEDDDEADVEMDNGDEDEDDDEDEGDEEEEEGYEEFLAEHQ